MTNPVRIIAIVQTEPTHGNFEHLTVRFGTRAHDGKLEVVHDYSSFPEHVDYATRRKTCATFAELSISCQIDGEGHNGRQGKSYAWRTSYSGRLEDPETAKIWARTLERVARKLEAIHDDIGRTETFGAYVARVLSALAVNEVIVLGRDGFPLTDTFPTQRRGSAVYDIDLLVDGLKAKLTGLPLAAVA